MLPSKRQGLVVAYVLTPEPHGAQEGIMEQHVPALSTLAASVRVGASEAGEEEATQDEAAPGTDTRGVMEDSHHGEAQLKPELETRAEEDRGNGAGWHHVEGKGVVRHRSGVGAGVRVGGDAMWRGGGGTTPGWVGKAGEEEETQDEAALGTDARGTVETATMGKRSRS
ncbi:hypothetical protein ABZP36_034666 [Zizania latifolia]